jgi:predicted nucleotide-binding protein (sugar kinase/HSP70/actin superfamily)
MSPEPIRHFKRPVEHPIQEQDRQDVTLLFGGLTVRQDILIEAAMQGLGYRCRRIPTPTKGDFQTGREYSDVGMCNPTYFTIGALLNYLRQLRDVEGLSTREIIDRYAYVTAGTCGPCRFGMYETQFRLALQNSGFDGFRVLIFQQGEGLDQGEAGLVFDQSFFLALINAVMIGDVLNDVLYRLRPYEIEAGAIDRLFSRTLDRLCEAMRSKPKAASRGRVSARVLHRLVPSIERQHIEGFLDQIFGDYYPGILEECAAKINEEVEVDYTRPKPICKVTGEFWAQTTEGDGNFNMFKFLESEGAELLVEPVTSWVCYLLAQERARTFDQKGVERLGEPRRFAPLRWLADEGRFWKKLSLIGLADRLLRREYDRVRLGFGGIAQAQINQLELQRLGHPYYNRKCEGGEGHLEVAKNIYYSNRELAHMVLSLKPFGCMPSMQSDGAQAAVLSRYPDMIFLPVETSGEGEINAHSRVQMALGEAKARTKEEFAACVKQTGYALETIRRYCAEHRDMRRPFQIVPRHKGVVGRAANFVLYAARLMDADPSWRRHKTGSRNGDAIARRRSPAFR